MFSFHPLHPRRVGGLPCQGCEPPDKHVPNFDPTCAEVVQLVQDDLRLISVAARRYEKGNPCTHKTDLDSFKRKQHQQAISPSPLTPCVTLVHDCCQNLTKLLFCTVIPVELPFVMLSTSHLTFMHNLPCFVLHVEPLPQLDFVESRSLSLDYNIPILILLILHSTHSISVAVVKERPNAKKIGRSYLQSMSSLRSPTKYLYKMKDICPVSSLSHFVWPYPLPTRPSTLSEQTCSPRKQESRYRKNGPKLRSG
jgi:hypothetical protein